jgi:hypothetical protein
MKLHGDKLTSPPRIVSAVKDELPPFNLDAHIIANGHRPLAPGEQWHRRDGWSQFDLLKGERPLLLNEPCPTDHDVRVNGKWTGATGDLHFPISKRHLHTKTSNPLPPLPAPATEEQDLGGILCDALCYCEMTTIACGERSNGDRIRLRRAGEKLASAVSAPLKAEIERLKGDLESEKSTRLMTYGQLQAARQRAETAEREIERLNLRIAKLEEDYGAVEHYYDDMIGFKQRAETAEARNRELEACLQELGLTAGSLQNAADRPKNSKSIIHQADAQACCNKMAEDTWRITTLESELATAQARVKELEALHIEAIDEQAAQAKIMRGLEAQLSTAREDNAVLEEVKAILQSIYNDTDCYADGAPDATSHDKMCNEVSTRIKQALFKLNATTP